MDYLFLVIGLALLLLGAEFLVDSSVAIAKRAKISSFIIGLTIVGMGTSAPELFVSLSSALSGHGDVAVGNIVGSNICNIFLILGVSAAITPFVIQKEIVKRDIPFGIFAVILLFVLANDSLIFGAKESGLSRMEGIVLLVLFVAYMAFTITKSFKNRGKMEEEEAESKLSGKPIPLLLLIAVASLAGLIGGGNLFLSSAENLARAWGVSEAVIAITVVALGTSLPELITSIIAALKDNSELALGNVIGSNVFNALFILGIASSAHPISIQGVRMEDFAVMIFAALCTLAVAFSFRKYFFTRGEGIFFLVCYVGYTTYLVMR